MNNILLEIGGKEYYFDIDKLASEVQYENDKKIVDSESSEINDLATLKIDVTKYEMYRDLIGTILTPNDIILDNKMGMMALNELPIPFKLSFNTLLMKGIIKEL
tara:strand:+ start:1732 stop:2043 length:312 start_codon:yes stop_codon:yes gene_type:complete